MPRDVKDPTQAVFVTTCHVGPYSIFYLVNSVYAMKIPHRRYLLQPVM